MIGENGDTVAVEPRTVWVHRPDRGAVAWLVAVATVPASPVLLVWVHTVLDAARDGHAPHRLGVVLVVGWAFFGGLLACAPAHRVARGLGVGMVAGALVCLVTLGLWGRL
ncbi:hypothetical protein [Nocardioides alcanivorans]|uniref:hypothetical protein n=1 Tax=Nocardioides alcanivorans TaxID=2897352 RepID=UPI001F1B3661|nr:hypothetical protein [Nocardioides alcanivorans]